jgi:hypothetical protein
MGGAANASSGGAGNSSGSPSGGTTASAGGGSAGEGGSAADGTAGAAPVTGFAAEFTPRAQAALKAAAPDWTCATTLPNVPVADAEAVRNTVRAFIAQAVDVPPTDITMTAQECSTPSTASCAEIFAHDTAKSGGSIYDTSRPLAQELEANATAIEVTVWSPVKDGMALSGVVVMAGIADGVLVGLIVFNMPDVCN